MPPWLATPGLTCRSRTSWTRAASGSLQPAFGLSMAIAPPKAEVSRSDRRAAQRLGVTGGQVDHALGRLHGDVRGIGGLGRDQGQVVGERLAAPPGDGDPQPGVGRAGAAGRGGDLRLGLGRDEEERRVHPAHGTPVSGSASTAPVAEAYHGPDAASRAAYDRPAMTRILLLVPSRTYRATDFVEAARALDVEVIVGTQDPSPIADAAAGGTVAVALDDIEAGRRAIVELDRSRPLDAVVPVDDGSTLVAAAAAETLGLAHNRLEAVEASRDKARTRELLARAGLLTPRFRTWPADADPDEVPTATFPVVVKPIDLSGSRGVIRADDPAGLAAAFARVASIVDCARRLPAG